MNSNTGTQVATFSGNASNSLKCGAAFLSAGFGSSFASAYVGARNLSVIRITQTYTFLTSR